jgi:hypothetical protein
MTNGLYTQPATFDVLAQVDPRFAEARAEYRAAPTDRLYNPDAILLDLLALRRIMAQRVEGSVDERGVQHPPPLLDVLNAILAAQERGLRVRRGIETVDHVHINLVNGLVHNVIQVLTKYVAPEKLAVALDDLRERQAALTPPRAAS